MGALGIAACVFAGACGCALAGVLLRRWLPPQHTDGETREVMKLVMGLIATMAALVLGLMIASSKASFDLQREELQEIAANILDLDRMLAHYGPETKPERDVLYSSVRRVAIQLQSRAGAMQLRTNALAPDSFGMEVFDRLHDLTPDTPGQRFLQERALQTATAIRHLHVLMMEQLRSGVPWPFLAVLMFWIALLFMGFGLFTRPHATIAVSLMVGALSVASAMFLILELRLPYQGMMRVSDNVFDGVLVQLGR